MLSDDFILGVDTSRHQGVMNWKAAADQGVKFAFVRCTVGDYYFDPQFIPSWEGCKNEGIAVAPYLVPAFARRNSGAIIPAEAQLAWFFKCFNNRIPDMPVVADCEAGMVRGVDAAGVSGISWKILRGLIGYSGWEMPLMYTNKDFADRYLIGNRWKEYPLFVASYLKVPAPVNYTFPPVMPNAWDEWQIHQFSADGNMQGHKYGASGSWAIDLDKMKLDFWKYITYDSTHETYLPIVSQPPELTESAQIATVAISIDEREYIGVIPEKV